MEIVRRFYGWIRTMLGRASRTAEKLLAVPQGLTEEQFQWLSAEVRGQSIQFGTEIFVHGSRAGGSATAKSDIDIAILVDSARFDEALRNSFGIPKAGSAKERTMQHAARTGKIQAGEAGLRPLRKLLEQRIGLEVDISVIRRGGPFDRPPYLPLRTSRAAEAQ